MASLDLIRRRTSVRSYSDRGVEASLRQALTDYAGSLAAPFGNRIRFAWVEVTRDAAGKPHAPGTYGMIQGARWYLAGVVKLAPGAIEDFGYLFEALVLKAADLGLGTCWLGGTFDRGDFQTAAAPADGEVIAAVTPVGYAAEKRHLQERIATGLLRVRQRKPLKDLVVHDGEVPPDLADALEAVRLGPSASNKQPWRLDVPADGRSVGFYLEESPGYNGPFEAKNGFKIQSLDLGIAMGHFEAVLADRGVSGTWSRQDPGAEVPGGWSFVAQWTRRE